MKGQFLILIVMIIVIIFTVGILAVNGETRNEALKDKNDKNITTNNEKIPPAPDYYYEDWVEPDDEEYYKFDIHPITPEKGITGGILIYYGHFVKPPYKVEIKNGEVLVNNLPVQRGPEKVLKKLSDRHKKREKAHLDSIKYPPELVARWNKCVKFNMKLEEKYRELNARIEKKEITEREAMEQMRTILSSSPEVKHFVHVAWNYVSIYHSDNECGGYVIRKPEKSPEITKKEFIKRKDEALKLSQELWSIKLNRYTNFNFGGYGASESNKVLKKIIKILKSKNTIQYKTYKLFKADLGGLRNAKLLLHNFNLIGYEEWFKEKNNE